MGDDGYLTSQTVEFGRAEVELTGTYSPILTAVTSQCKYEPRVQQQC